MGIFYFISSVNVYAGMVIYMRGELLILVGLLFLAGLDLEVGTLPY